MSLFRKRDTGRCFPLVLYSSLIFNAANLVHLQGVFRSFLPVIAYGIELDVHANNLLSPILSYVYKVVLN